MGGGHGTARQRGQREPAVAWAQLTVAGQSGRAGASLKAWLRQTWADALGSELERALVEYSELRYELAEAAQPGWPGDASTCAGNTRFRERAARGDGGGVLR